MLRSPSERRLWSAIRTASSAKRVQQILLLDDLHRDLFLDETRLETLAILDGLVTKTPLRSGFHLVLLEHEILDEILRQIESDPESVSSRYSRQMIGAWRFDTTMSDWAKAHYNESFQLDHEIGLAGSILSSSDDEDDSDLFESWFYKFQTDLLAAIDYIMIADQSDIIQSLQNRIQACLQEINQENIVAILLQINDLCHIVFERGVSAIEDQDLDDIKLRISSLQYGFGQVHCSHGQSSDCSADIDRKIPNEEEPDQKDLSAMFQSIATRDKTIETEQGAAGDDINILIQRFDPVFGNR